MIPLPFFFFWVKISNNKKKYIYTFFFLNLMLRCIQHLPKGSFRLIREPCHYKRFYSSNSKPILTELVYGRKRIYTSLPTMAKTKSPTASKTRAASPVTSSRLSWEWINPSEDNNYYATKQKNSGALSAVKQNLTEMFLPVG